MHGLYSSVAVIAALGAILLLFVIWPLWFGALVFVRFIRPLLLSRREARFGEQEKGRQHAGLSSLGLEQFDQA